MPDTPETPDTPDTIQPQRKLSPAAERALAEAEARRKVAKAPVLPREVNGTALPEPTRYGDWEKKGLTSDF